MATEAKKPTAWRLWRRNLVIWAALMALLVDGLRLDYRLAQPAVTATLLCATFAVNSKWTFRARQAR